MSVPQISVVIVTYRRPTELKRCLLALLQQTVPPHEIFVIDNGARIGDEARYVCEAISKSILVRYIVSPVNSLPVARNLGVRHCAGNFVALIDDDVCLSSDYLEVILRVFEQRPDAVGVQGYINPGQRAQWREYIQRAFSLYHVRHNSCQVLPTISTTYPASLTHTMPCEWLSGSNQVYRRDVLEDVRWDERLLKYADGEDVDHSYRVYLRYPGRLFITPQARVIHDAAAAGRVVGRELITMRETYGWYLLHKLYPHSFWAKCVYIWSRFGRFIITLGVAITQRRQKAWDEAWLVIAAYCFVWRHSKAISVGNLGDFNAKYLCVKGQEKNDG